MAQTIVQTNFTTGELTPEAASRIDIAKYQNAAKLMRNVIVQVLGGAKGRGGFRFVAGTKHNNKRSRLIPYIFSRDQAYMLEFGDGYMRVFKDGAQVLSSSVPYEISTPYLESMLSGIGYVQGADTMFMAHQLEPISRLRRLDHDDWLFDPAPFSATPVDEIGHRPNASLGISDPTVGIGRTLSTVGSAFLASDVGRQIVASGGVAKITAVASSTSATADVTTEFRDVGFAAYAWTITGSPQAAIKPSKKDPVGEPITLDADVTTTTEVTKAITGLTHNGFGTASVTIVGHGYGSGNTLIISGNTPAAYNGTYTITVTGADTFNYALSPDPGVATVLGSVNRSVNTTPDVWRAEDVGKFVTINGGLVQITQIITAKQAKATITTVMTADIKVQPNAWLLKSSMWNDIDGYPGSVSLYEQRLIAGGSPAYADYVWMSRIGQPLNFILGTKDDDALSIPVYSDQINPIAHIVQTKALMALTYGGESTIVGGIERPITPTNIQIKNQSTHGCTNVRPVRIGNQIFFLQRGSTALRATSYQADSDGYVAPEISKLSRHLMTVPIVDMAYQQSPDSVIWLVREDGIMLTVTIDSTESVIAWTWHETDGAFESVACIPSQSGADEVWVITRRLVDGNTVRYVERLDDGVHTDSCKTGTTETATALWGGFNHLVGKTLQVVADGIPITSATVNSSGEILLEREAESIEAGLQYIPRVEMLTPELISQTGSAQGNDMRIHRATLVMLNTVGCKLDGEYVEFREFDTEVLDQAIAPFTGQKDLSILGWERGRAEIVIEQDQPLPFHILSVIRKFTVNG